MLADPSSHCPGTYFDEEDAETCRDVYEGKANEHKRDFITSLQTGRWKMPHHHPPVDVVRISRRAF